MAIPPLTARARVSVIPFAVWAAACSDTGAPADTTVLDTSVGEVDDTADATNADTGDVEVAADVVPDCVGVVCDPFEYCAANVCLAYPACAQDETCEAQGEVCRSGFCVPADVDIDGDGHVAGDDCDETDTEVHPLADEGCNGVDDDCNGETDEGDAAALCATSGTGDLCAEGTCVCANGAFDLDPEAPGCECLATIAADQGLTCETPIELGDFADDGSVQMIEGTLVPAGREVWYRFRGVDSADTSCDNYHVRVRFESDPDAAYAFDVCRGACRQNCMQYLIDYDWRTDFRATIEGILTGQCPCTAPGARGASDVSVCENDTADYFVRVYRRPDKPVLCSPYRIEISNGLYDTP